MSITFLILKCLSQVLIVASGIYGMFSDLYKQDEHTKHRSLTRAGWVNLATILAGFVLFGVTEYKDKQDQLEQQVQSKKQTDALNSLNSDQKKQLENQNTEIIKQDHELGYLHHLILVQESVEGWEMSWEPPSRIISEARKQAAQLTGKDDAYLRTCLQVSDIEARKSSNEHWVITCAALARGGRVLQNVTFDLSPTQAEWAVFESTLDALLTARFSISQLEGEDFVLLTRLSRPDEISYTANRVVVILRNSRVKLSRLEQPVQAVFRLDTETLSDAPNTIRVRSLDPNLKMDQSIRMKWSKRQVGTKPYMGIDPADEGVTQEPVFALFSGPHEIKGSFNKLLFSFEKLP